MDKNWAIVGTRSDTKETVFWQNIGQPTVWQPEPKEWLFERSAAEQIASQMQGVITFDENGKEVTVLDVKAARYKPTGNCANRQETVWVVGQYISGSDRDNMVWELQGIFTVETKALEAVVDRNYFIGKVELNKALPHETVDWDVRYPLADVEAVRDE